MDFQCKAVTLPEVFDWIEATAMLPRSNTLSNQPMNIEKNRLLFADGEFNFGLIAIQGKKPGKIFRG